MPNLTSTSELLLLELSDTQELQILHFFVFLAVYLTAVTGNLLIIIAVALDHDLHTPMCFFLMNLALLDLGMVSVVVPKAMANSLLNTRSISYSACVAQVFFLFFFGESDNLVEVGIIIFNSFLALGCFSFIVVSYVQIFAAVLRIPSVHGRKKALSTCLPHLTVVCLLVFSSIFAYVRPHNDTSSVQNILFAIIYAILPPLLNPFIYGMRNKEIKTALLKLSLIGGMF